MPDSSTSPLHPTSPSASQPPPPPPPAQQQQQQQHQQQPLSRLTPAAFIAQHTTSLPSAAAAAADVDPPLDDCPICLDEPTLRITGIQACSHRIGRACLEKLLLLSPATEKKCPLCRAVWIPAAAPSARAGARQWDANAVAHREEELLALLTARLAHAPQPPAHAAPELSEAPRPRHRHSMQFDERLRDADRASGLRRWIGGGGGGGTVRGVDDASASSAANRFSGGRDTPPASSSDDDYMRQARFYVQYTRDIEAVRRRARESAHQPFFRRRGDRQESSLNGNDPSTSRSSTRTLRESRSTPQERLNTSRRLSSNPTTTTATAAAAPLLTAPGITPHHQTAPINYSITTTSSTPPFSPRSRIPGPCPGPARFLPSSSTTSTNPLLTSDPLTSPSQPSSQLTGRIARPITDLDRREAELAAREAQLDMREATGTPHRAALLGGEQPAGAAPAPAPAPAGEGSPSISSEQHADIVALLTRVRDEIGECVAAMNRRREEVEGILRELEGGGVRD